jgi:hypothetical protein
MMGAGVKSFFARSVEYDTIEVMNTTIKLLNAMKNNPVDWQIGQLQTVANQYGITWRQQGSSHCVFVRSDGCTLSVPSH